MCKIRLVLKVAECYIICFIKAEYAEQKKKQYLYMFTRAITIITNNTNPLLITKLILTATICNWCISVKNIRP